MPVLRAWIRTNPLPFVANETVRAYVVWSTDITQPRNIQPPTISFSTNYDESRLADV